MRTAAQASLYVVVLLAGLAVGAAAIFPSWIGVDQDSPAAAPTTLLLLLCGAILAALGRIRLADEVRTLRGLPPRVRPGSRYQLSRSASTAVAIAAGLAAAAAITYWLTA